MSVGSKVEDHVDEFNKLVLDLENIEVVLEEEDREIIFLTSLSDSYEHFVETLMYGRESLTMEEVLAALNSKELKKRGDVKEEFGEGLLTKGRTDKRSGHPKGNSSNKPKSKFKRKCYICHSEDHLKKDCPERKKSKGKSNARKNESGNTDSCSDGYDSAEVLVVSALKNSHEWVLDSGGSFHMTPNKDFLHNFKSYDGGMVLLGDNKPCRVIGEGSVYFKLNNNKEIKLEKGKISTRVEKKFGITW